MTKKTKVSKSTEANAMAEAGFQGGVMVRAGRQSQSQKSPEVALKSGK